MNWHNIRVYPRGFVRTILIIVLLAWVVVLGIFRFFSGRPLFVSKDNRPTDATFLKPGTEQFRKSARLSRWAFMPEWKRAAVRTLVLALSILVPVALVTGAWIAWTVVAILVGNVSWLMGIKSMAAVKNWKWNRTVVRPLQSGLAPILGVTEREVVVNLAQRRRKDAA